MNELNHVAIIVDGNGRWAKERGKTRSEGHLEGSKNLERLIIHISKTTDIKVLSLYVFSTENFSREKKEVDYLMKLFVKMFKLAEKKYKKENIKILFSGTKENLNKDVINEMNRLENETKDNTGLIVNFCLNYGGRKEIIDTTKLLVQKVKNNELDVNDITEDLFKEHLYNILPDVDFLIRTSGEQRISNFLLYQISYAEFIFVKTYFPAFNEQEFDKIIKEFYTRNRRFGKIKE